MRYNSHASSKSGQIKRSLFYSIVDGSAFSGMVGFTQEYMTPFALALKATTAQIGLLSSILNLVVAVSPEQRTQNIAVFKAITGFAICLGALVGGFLATHLPPIFGYQADIISNFRFYAWPASHQLTERHLRSPPGRGGKHL